jgi:hypothetical protein
MPVGDSIVNDYESCGTSIDINAPPLSKASHNLRNYIHLYPGQRSSCCQGRRTLLSQRLQWSNLLIRAHLPRLTINSCSQELSGLARHIGGNISVNMSNLREAVCIL